MKIGFEHSFASGKRRYEHKQGRARQMKICEQRANYLESKSRIYKDAGLTLASTNPSRFQCGVLQSPDHRRTHRDDSAFLLQRAINCVRGRRADAVALDVQSVGFHALFAQRLKCSESDMQCDLDDLHSATANLVEDLRSEVKAGGRGCNGSAIARKHSLIALAISRF